MTFIFIAPIFAVVKYNLVYFGHPPAENRSTLIRRIYRLKLVDTRSNDRRHVEYYVSKYSAKILANTQSILGRYMPVDTRSKSPVLLPLWCVDSKVLITSAVHEVKGSRSPGMVQSCIWMSRSCFGISSTGKFVTCGLVLGFDIVTPEWVGDIARSLPVLSATMNI